MAIIVKNREGFTSCFKCVDLDGVLPKFSKWEPRLPSRLMSSTQSPILVSKLSCKFPLRHLISWMFNMNAHVVQIAGILRYSLASHRSSQCFNDEISSSVIHETSMALNNIIGSMLWVFSRIAYLNVEDPAALDQALAAQAHL